jgi:hypothetical protein
MLASLLLAWPATPGAPDPRIRLLGLKRCYQAPDPIIKFRVHHVFPKAITIGFSLERKVPDGGWVIYWYDIFQSCGKVPEAEVGLRFPPGNENPFSWSPRDFDKSCGLLPGIYRFVIKASIDGVDFQEYSPVFEISHNCPHEDK